MSAQPLVGVYLDPEAAGLLVRIINDYDAALRAAPGGRVLGRKVMGLRDELDRANARVRTRSSNVSSNVSQVGVQHDPAQSEVYAFIDSRQAAAVLGISPSGVRDLARRGRLVSRKAGGRWVYSLADAERIAAERAHGLRR